MLGAKAVDPGIHCGLVDNQASLGGRERLGDHPRLQSEPVVLLCRGLGLVAWHGVVGGPRIVHAGQCRPTLGWVPARSPVLRVQQDLCTRSRANIVRFSLPDRAARESTVPEPKDACGRQPASSATVSENGWFWIRSAAGWKWRLEATFRRWSAGGFCERCRRSRQSERRRPPRLRRRLRWSPETGQVAKRGSPLGAADRPGVRHGQYSEEARR